MSYMCKSDYFDFVQNCQKVLGVGFNYNDIWKINNVSKPKDPIIFLKSPSSFIQEGQDIIVYIPNDFVVNEEIELGIIIGTKCKDVKENDAMNYVAGYCAAIDLTSVCDLSAARKSGVPWYHDKGFDTACPVSRFITKGELPDPNNAGLWLMVNDEMRQEANTNDLIFSIPYLISYISRFITLEPNDLILTGTPPGMSPIYPGDVIKAGIKDLVTVTFRVHD